MSLEASYIDRDTEYSNRLSELEALCVEHLTNDSDPRLVALEKALADLAAWLLGMEGVLDDVRLHVEKIESKCDQVVFDNTPPSIGLPSPSSSGGHGHCFWLRLQIAQGSWRQNDYTGYGLRGRHDLDAYPAHR
jgi:hypothetical protein